MKREEIESVMEELEKENLAFPFKFEMIDHVNNEVHIQYQYGLSKLDYFAGQYMAAGKLPDEAFRLARLAMKERGSDG